MPPKSATKAYGASDRRALDRLIETTGRETASHDRPDALSETPFDDDTLHEECGVFGIFGHADAGALTVLGLHALQHRGQEAAGIVTYRRRPVHRRAPSGPGGRCLRPQNRTPPRISRAASPSAMCAIPPPAAPAPATSSRCSPIWRAAASRIAHNGNLTNAHTLRTELVARRRDLPVHLRHRNHRPSGRRAATAIRIVDKLIDALKQVEGAYSLVALTSKKLIGVRDPYGVRPLVLGKLDGALDPGLGNLRARHHRRANSCATSKPGEMVVVTKDGIESHFPFKPQPHRFCVFEYIYFARPDSTVEGRNVYEARKRIGEVLARGSPGRSPTW